MNAQRRMHAYGYYYPSSEVVRAQPLPSWRSPRLSPTGPRTEHGRRTPQRFQQDPALVDVPARRGRHPRSARVLRPVYYTPRNSAWRGSVDSPRARFPSPVVRSPPPSALLPRIVACGGRARPPFPLALRPAKLALRTRPHAAYGRAFPRPAPPRAFLGDAGWPLYPLPFCAFLGAAAAFRRSRASPGPDPGPGALALISGCRPALASRQGPWLEPELRSTTYVWTRRLRPQGPMPEHWSMRGRGLCFRIKLSPRVPLCRVALPAFCLVLECCRITSTSDLACRQIGTSTRMRTMALRGGRRRPASRAMTTAHRKGPSVGAPAVRSMLMRHLLAWYSSSNGPGSPGQQTSSATPH
ncbi:hypothetical protein C8Q78DRAFT_607030 [Trametes maxima]|nr:hypothetical protein C8Q78DRAFT_607030 [Trametes maxima]